MLFASSHAFLSPEEIVIPDFFTSSHARFMILLRLYFLILFSSVPLIYSLYTYGSIKSIGNVSLIYLRNIVYFVYFRKIALCGILIMEVTIMDEKKWEIPRGPAATAAKNKYRDKNYDRMELAVPKGMKARVEEIYKELGYASKNAFVVDAIKEKYEHDTGKQWS
nr:MAG TPA: Ribbon-helix-helix protein, copG family [Bacteriophage sp.]